MAHNELLHIGILGASNIAQRSILPALASLPDQFRIVGVGSRSMDTAQPIAAQYNCKAFDSYDALLQDESLDAVYISLPNGLHYEWAMNALRSGKHVLCEKSLGCTQREVAEMVSLAERQNLTLIENFQFRFHRQLQELRRLLGLEEGVKSRIGDIRTIRCSFGFPPFSDQDNIRYQKKLGGGALLDAGAYTIKVATLLLGRNIQVSTASLIADDTFGVDIHGSGCLINPDTGITAHIAFGFDHYYQCGVEIWGAKGRLRTNRLFTARAEMNPVFEIETVDSGLAKYSIAKDDHFVNMLRHFHELCASDQGPKRAEEYAQNCIQAELLNSFRQKASHR
ncbi:Gfo/Idh/MocA family protein [Flagellimonas marinaquae]